MTQLDCKRKWKKNKQKQIQKSKQLSLLWVVLICPRKGADPCETSKRFQKSVMPRFVAGHLHEALPGPASRTRLLIPAVPELFRKSAIQDCPRVPREAEDRHLLQRACLTLDPGDRPGSEEDDEFQSGQ